MNDQAPATPPSSLNIEAGASPALQPSNRSVIDPTRMSLILGIRNADDQRRWIEFASIYEPLIVAYVRKQGVPWHEVDELVQQIFIKLWRGVESYDRSKARFRVWLYGMVRNAVVDYFRVLVKEAKQREAAGDRAASLVRPDEPGKEWLDDLQRQIAQVAMAEVRADVAAATWACFERTKIAGRPAADVAQELGTSIGAVYTNTSRVLDKLSEAAAKLKKEWDDGA